MLARPATSLWMELIAVSGQGFTNFLRFGFDNRTGSAKVSRLFLRQMRGKMAGARPAMLCLASGGQPETLLRALVCLLFRHLCLQSEKR